MRWRLATALVVCFSAGCSTPPTVRAMSAGADGVIYQFPSDRQEEATREAMLYCANLGRAAILKRVELGAEGLATGVYQCR